MLRSRLRLADLAGEVLAGVLQRPARTAFTTLGTVFGVGAFVAVLGLTATATGQISKRFSALAATEVSVQPVQAQNSGDARESVFPADAADRVRRINGVVRAGVFWTVAAKQVGGVTGVPRPGADVLDQQDVIAADAGLLPAAGARVSAGRLFDGFHDARRERVAVLGAAVAQQLGIDTLDQEPAIFLGDTPFTVIGIVDDVQRQPSLLLAVIVPRRTAEQLWPPRPDDTPDQRLLVETRLGAAGTVAAQAGLALDPAAPDRFTVTAPPDPRGLRDAVDADLSTLFLVLASVCLAVGALGIANTTLVAVLERVPEIGLRRSLGARPRHVAVQFLAESAMQGTLGGLVGMSLGVGVVIAVALARHWTPILEPWTVLPAPLIGTAVGLLAGAYPAVRAARIEPVEALRR